MKFRIIDKYYSKEDNLFHIVKERKYTFDKKEKSYSSFDEFYKALNKDLKDANLVDYNFDGVDLNKYDLSNAKISSSVMIKLGTYKDKLFRTITKDSELSNIVPSTLLNLVQSRQLDVENIDNDSFVLCYISDLHINHKLLKKFKNSVNEYELSAYFKEIIQKLKNSLPTFNNNNSVVFVGDISYNFEVFKMFFNIYREELPYQKTFVILGNHELWDEKLNKSCKSVEEIIEKYRTFLNSFSIEIQLLENQLFLPNDKQHIYSEEEILALDNKTLREKFLRNGYAIFGGIGYSGMNKEFNANQGVYKTQYITREQEKERSNLINTLHEKLSNVAYDKKLFFITHMPKEDWSTSGYNKNWYYISGHTHKNYYIENKDKKVYADNQVGYTNDSFAFKYLFTSMCYDIFQDYADGIYEITREQYKLFYYGIGERIYFNRNFKKLFMLKRKGIYCFLLKPNENGELKLLNGGIIKNVGKHDLDYFYTNLENYATSIKMFLESYNKFQKQISNIIKKIGGSGYIHGCIIDIDFNNHIYVNPLDTTITPYFAYSMTHKYVYKNLISLLKSHNKELYNNYVKLLDNKSSKNNLIVLNDNLQESNEKVFVAETDMYKISKILKGLQYTTKNNIVRLWNDTIASNCTKESGRLIVNGIINPEEMKQIKTKQIMNEKHQKQIEREKKKFNAKPQLTKEEKKINLLNRYCDKIAKINKNIKIVSYNGAKEKAKYRCQLCGFEWSCRPDHLYDRYKYKCPKCKNI